MSPCFRFQEQVHTVSVLAERVCTSFYCWRGEGYIQFNFGGKINFLLYCPGRQNKIHKNVYESVSGWPVSIFKVILRLSLSVPRVPTTVEPRIIKLGPSNSPKLCGSSSWRFQFWGHLRRIVPFSYWFVVGEREQKREIRKIQTWVSNKSKIRILSQQFQFWSLVRHIHHPHWDTGT